MKEAAVIAAVLVLALFLSYMVNRNKKDKMESKEAVNVTQPTENEVKDYYYSEQSARHWHNMNHRDRGGYTLMKNKVNGILYTERVAHGRKPACKVTDAVLVASGVEGKDLMVEYTNVAW